PLPVTVLPNENFTKYVVPGQSVELSCPHLGPQRKFLMPNSLNMWTYVSRLGEHHLAMEMLPDIKFRDQDTTLIIKRFAPQHVNYYICESSWDEVSEKHMFIFQLEMASKSRHPSKISPINRYAPYIIHRQLISLMTCTVNRLLINISDRKTHHRFFEVCIK
ncbi:hypothetical protein AHF37_05412, partial [Paragonimus kellicotti]